MIKTGRKTSVGKKALKILNKVQIIKKNFSNKKQLKLFYHGNLTNTLKNAFSYTKISYLMVKP